MLLISVVLLSTILGLGTLWGDYLTKNREERSLLKDVMLSVLILVVSGANFLQSRIDAQEHQLERETDSLRYRIQYDSLVANNREIRRAKELATESLSYLYKTSEREREDAFDEFDRQVLRTFNSIQRRSESLYFPSISDSLALLKKMEDAVKEISDLIESISTNPVLRSNPIAYKYYRQLDSAMKEMRLPLSGYDRGSVQELHGKLFSALVKFCQFNTVYTSKKVTYKLSKLEKLDSTILEQIETRSD